LLTVVDASAIAGFSLQNLPVEVEYVADVSNGEAIVVTEPMDPWGYSGFRLFYGTPSQMIERVAGPKCVGRPRDAETAAVTYNVLITF
jgi:hypothetical protein